MSFVEFNQDLVALGVQAEQKETVIKILSDKLFAQGFVKDTFYQNVLDREAVFPTGLPTIIPMAICHTESEHVYSSAIAVGTVASPVTFQEMGTPERTVMAEIVFVIALKNPKDQVPWLQKMMTVFKDEVILTTIRDADDPDELVRFLNEVFT